MEHRFRNFVLLLAAIGLLMQSCSFFSNPNEAGSVGELQINVRFAGTPAAPVEEASIARAGQAQSSPQQAIDRIVIVVFKHFEFQDHDQFPDREILRQEIPVGDNRVIRAALQVPLQNDELNCFIVRIGAFEHTISLYSGEDVACFNEDNKSVSLTILLQPAAFRVNFPFENVTSTNNRVTNFSLQVQDAAVTDLEIMAESAMQRLPLGNLTFFNHPIIAFGDTTTVRLRAFFNQEFRGELQRRIVYTGRRADVLVVLVWDQPVDLDLEIIHPLNPRLPITPAAPGDSVGGRGLLILNDANGFGPEVYEWRDALLVTQGNISINVRRLANVAASGRIYVMMRENLKPKDVQVIPFAFQLTDQPVQTITQITWPP